MEPNQPGLPPPDEIDDTTYLFNGIVLNGPLRILPAALH